MKVILLAAGNAQRMGQPKQLLSWQNKSLLQLSLDKLTDIGVEIMLVLGANVDEIRTSLDGSYNILENPQWQQGIGTSLALAISKLEQNDAAVLILLADQIALTKDDIKTLINNWEKDTTKICCSYFEEKPSTATASNHQILTVPAIFPVQYFSELASLSGKIGAKNILHREQQNINKVHLQNSKININTPIDWENWQQQQSLTEV